MAGESPLSIMLSQEELAVVVHYLEADTLLGLEPELFAGLSANQVTLVLGVAERALVARGFLKPGADNRFQVEPAVFAVVGACVFPETSLIVTQIRPGTLAETCFFHISRRMIVMHTIPMTAIHQFIAVEEKEAIARAVLSILDLDVSFEQPLGEPAQVGQAILVHARDVAQAEGPGAAFHVLSQTNMNEEVARELAATLAQPVANTTLAYIEHKEEGELSDGFTVLQGQGALWLLTPVEDSATESILVLPVSAEEAIQRVKALLKL